MIGGGSVALVNLTPHDVVVYRDGAATASWAPSGSFARRVELVGTPGVLLTDQAQVPRVEVDYGDAVVDLPAPRAGTALIVSRVIADAVRRSDLFFPFGEVRDEEGRVVGCTALGRFPATDQEGDSRA